MPRFVAFLRAVNVRPRMIRMETVRAALTDAGFIEVQTHIQTGNVLVGTRLRSSRKVEAAVDESLSAAAGFDVVSMVRTPAQVREVLAWAEALPPLLKGAAVGGRRYLAFARDPLDAAAVEQLATWASPAEAAAVRGSDVLVELGVPVHQARLTNTRLERMAGPTTTRDITVVRSIVEKWS